MSWRNKTRAFMSCTPINGHQAKSAATNMPKSPAATRGLTVGAGSSANGNWSANTAATATGAKAPRATPNTAPMAAAVITSSPMARVTTTGRAPTDLSMAMVSIFSAVWARTAPAIPRYR